MFKKSVLWLAGAIHLTAWAGTDNLIDIQYGRIEQVQQVQLKASYGTGTLLGGGLGALAASGHSTTSALLAGAGGALLGALVSRERAGTAEQYTVRLVNGNTVAIVSEAHDLETGDCVAVEQGKHANLRRVNPQMCDTKSPATSYPQVHAAVQRVSADCAAAKEEMLKATTEQETRLAYQKMKALCSEAQ
jgi:hypothetical protein